MKFCRYCRQDRKPDEMKVRFKIINGFKQQVNKCIYCIRKAK